MRGATETREVGNHPVFHEAKPHTVGHTSIRLKSGCVESVFDPTVCLDGAGVGERSPRDPSEAPTGVQEPPGAEFPVTCTAEGRRFIASVAVAAPGRSNTQAVSL